jgi:dCTP deaminase
VATKITVVQSKQAFDDAGGLRGNVIRIYEFDPNQITDSKSSNVSYDLRVGEEYKGHADMHKTGVAEGDKVRLDPGAAVIIETEEEVNFPRCRFGHIVPKVTLLQKGISNTSSKVDPGYSGKLLITVFNLGKKTVELKRKEPFCTLYVLNVEDGSIAYEKQGKKLEGNFGYKNLFAKVADYTERHPTLFAVLVNIVTTISIIVALMNTLYKPRESARPPEIPNETYTPSQSVEDAQ